MKEILRIKKHLDFIFIWMLQSEHQLPEGCIFHVYDEIQKHGHCECMFPRIRITDTGYKKRILCSVSFLLKTYYLTPHMTSPRA